MKKQETNIDINLLKNDSVTVIIKYDDNVFSETINIEKSMVNVHDKLRLVLAELISTYVRVKRTEKETVLVEKRINELRIKAEEEKNKIINNV